MLTDCCSTLIALGIFRRCSDFCQSLCCSPFVLPKAFGKFVELVECFRGSCESDISGDDNWLFAQFGIVIMPLPMLFASMLRWDFRHFADSNAGEFWFIFGQFGWWHLIRCGDSVNVSAFGRRSSSWFLYLQFVIRFRNVCNVRNGRRNRKEEIAKRILSTSAISLCLIEMTKMRSGCSYEVVFQCTVH